MPSFTLIGENAVIHSILVKSFPYLFPTYFLEICAIASQASVFMIIVCVWMVCIALITAEVL